MQRYIESLGTGFLDMKKACVAHGLPVPKIEIEGNTFSLNIGRRIEGEKSDLKSERSKETSAIQVKRLMRENKNITREEIASSLSLSVGGIRNIIAKLKASKEIKRIGPDKGGHWKVLK